VTAGLLAALPLAVILLGMGVLRRSAVAAGAAGLGVALLLALGVFGLDAGAGAGAGAGRAGLGVAAEAGFSTLTILWIILPALAIYEYQQRTGAIARIRDMLAALSDDPRVLAILIAFFFGLFLEGAAGFGTPVALAAPLLVGLGHPPVRAVVLALLGHAAGVSFGAIGTPILAQGAMGLDAGAIAWRTAALHAAAGPILLLAMLRMAAPEPLSRGDLGWAAAAAGCFFAPSLALAALAGPELPTLGGALLGAVGFVLLHAWRRGSRVPASPTLLADLAPYLGIVILVLLTRLVPPLQAGLSGLALDWRLDGDFSGRFEPLYHPGTMLAAGLLGAALWTGQAGRLAPATVAALRRLAPVALALLVMLTLSRLMVHAGMIAALAELAAGTGAAWPLLAPLLGVLGTLVTGSATASNILLTELQVAAAEGLGLPLTTMAAAQSFGAAIGNVVAPHNIIAGCATVGLTGREGDILARTVWPCLAAAAIGGLLVLGATLGGG
jgi:lactate permease